MAGARCPPEDADLPHPARVPPVAAAADLVSDDDRSVAADSWSIKSEYGSTLDDEQRQAEVLSTCTFPAPSDCRSSVSLFFSSDFFLTPLRAFDVRIQCFGVVRLVSWM